jgi:hypothetical protein
VQAQNLTLGGLADVKPVLFLTPSVFRRKNLKNKTVWEAAPFGMKPIMANIAASTAGTVLAGSGGTGETYD